VTFICNIKHMRGVGDHKSNCIQELCGLLYLSSNVVSNAHSSIVQSRQVHVKAINSNQRFLGPSQGDILKPLQQVPHCTKHNLYRSLHQTNTLQQRHRTHSLSITSSNKHPSAKNYQQAYPFPNITLFKPVQTLITEGKSILEQAKHHNPTF